MLDATGEQKREAVGIHPPHQRPDSKRGPLRGNELQADRSPSLQQYLGPHFRPVRADVHGLAGSDSSHRTESIYRRYAIVDEAMLKEGAAKLQTLHEAQAPAAPSSR
jgi:hypothetical protein